MRVEVAALSTDVGLLVGVQEGRPLHTWFRGSFGAQWEYASLVHYHPALRAVFRAYAARKLPSLGRLQQGSEPVARRWNYSLFEQWKYRLLVHFHPVLREVVARYASRIVPVPPPDKRRSLQLL